MSVKQGGIKNHFLSLWYDSTWDWTLVSRAIGKHSAHKANEPVYSLSEFFRWGLVSIIFVVIFWAVVLILVMR